MSNRIALARRYLEKKGLNPEDIDSIRNLLRLGGEGKEVTAALVLLKDRLGLDMPLLKSLLDHRDQEVRNSALEVLVHHLGNDGAAFYVELMSDGRFREKEPIVGLILFYGGEESIPVMLKRLRSQMKRKEAPHLFHNGESDLTKALAFLHRFRGRKEVAKAFEELLAKWELVEEREAFWITDQLDFFNRPELKRPGQPLPAVMHPVPADHPLFEASAKGDVEALRQLLESGKMTVYSGHPSIPAISLEAVRKGHLAVLKLLMEFGLEVNRPAHGFRQFLLIEAMSRDQEEMVRFLLANGANVNQPDEFGFTPFRAACVTPGIDLKYLSLLIEAGGRFEGCVIESARGNQVERLAVLKASGADVNERTPAGATALMVAAGAGKLEAVRWLLENGASPHLTGRHGETALDGAERNQHLEIAKLLRAQP